MTWADALVGQVRCFSSYEYWCSLVTTPQSFGSQVFLDCCLAQIRIDFEGIINVISQSFPYQGICGRKGMLAGDTKNIQRQMV